LKGGAGAPPFFMRKKAARSPKTGAAFCLINEGVT